MLQIMQYLDKKKYSCLDKMLRRLTIAIDIFKHF